MNFEYNQTLNHSCSVPFRRISIAVVACDNLRNGTEQDFVYIGILILALGADHLIFREFSVFYLEQNKYSKDSNIS